MEDKGGLCSDHFLLWVVERKKKTGDLDTNFDLTTVAKYFPGETIMLLEKKTHSTLKRKTVTSRYEEVIYDDLPLEKMVNLKVLDVTHYFPSLCDFIAKITSRNF